MVPLEQKIELSQEIKFKNKNQLFGITPKDYQIYLKIGKIDN